MTGTEMTGTGGRTIELYQLEQEMEQESIGTTGAGVGWTGCTTLLPQAPLTAKSVKLVSRYICEKNYERRCRLS